MVNIDPAFGHNFLQITIGNCVSDIEKHSVQDHGSGIVAAFEINRHGLIRTLKIEGLHLAQLADTAQASKTLRQNLVWLHGVRLEN